MAFWNKKKTSIQNIGNTVFGIQSVDLLSKSYLKSLDIIYKGYSNLLPFGNSGIQTVINYRRSWIIGKDTTVAVDGDRENQYLKFLNSYIQKQIFFSKLSTYGEIEGKVLIILMVERVQNGIKIFPKVIPYYTNSYEIKYDSFDNPETAIIGKSEINSDRFVFAKFNLFEYQDKNVSPPNISFVTDNIINADKAYSDWRSINDRSAKTTIVFETEEWEDAQIVSQIVKGKQETPGYNSDNPSESGKKWKIGEGLAIKGRANMLQFNLQGVQSLKDEIIANAQKISGHTGIPIFLLGFPEVMSNRATAKEMAEAIRNKTMTERSIWQEKIKELYTKIFKLYSAITNIPLNTDSIKVTIPAVSAAEVEQLVATYGNLVNQKILSKRTYQEMLPEVNPEIEAERIAEENKQDADIITESVNRMYP